MPATKSVPTWLTRDYFPATERIFRRTVYNRVGALAFAALVSLLCGLYLHPHGLILFWGITTLTMLGVAWPWLAMRVVRGQMRFARDRAREGEPVDVDVSIVNRAPTAVWGLVVRPGLRSGPHADQHMIEVVPGRDGAQSRWSFEAGGRGVYPSGPPELASGFPFGLVTARRTMTVAGRLVVWPRTYPVGPVPAVGDDHRHEGTATRSKSGTNGDVIGVRPYRRGDSPRRMHWGQSAKHGRLIVCELQANARPSVHLVLDAAPAVAGDLREWAIRVFASFVEGWLRDGFVVAATVGDQFFPAASGRKQREAVLDAVAALGPNGPPLVSTLAGPIGACLQVVVTSTPGYDALPDRVRRHPDRRFVVLSARGFAGDSGGDERPAGAWVWLPGPSQVAGILRHGWREAVHG